ncbi:MAG: serpin family protein [Saprospirales bacterium]|nr:serpin family protein [Saprospirales bacterium]
MKNTLLPFLLIALTLLAFQCKKDNPALPDGINFSCDDNPTTCELTDANGDFAINLFKQLNTEEPDDNIFFSPFSISTALTMTANGANGQTLDDMRNTLQIAGLDMPAVNESYKQLLEVIPGLDPQTKVKLANSIWPKIDYPVLESFLELNSNYFNSEVIPVDFKAPGVIDQVNGWIEDHTDGLLKETLKQLPPDVVMLLINAIYFKGTWQTEFEPDNTQPANFYTANGPVEVDMMHIPESDFPYFTNDLFQAIDLPYGDSIFSMSVFLPTEGHSVGDVIDALNPDSWDQWTNAFFTQPVSLYLPKFKMEYKKELKRTLSDMGMEVAFTGFADFGKMIDGGGVMIDDVIHHAFVEVDEKGTEAAAVTVVIIVETSAGSVPIMNINKPFVFVIRDNKTNSILFMGKVMKI